MQRVLKFSIMAVLLIGMGGCVASCVDGSSSKPKRFEDMTNKEYKQFKEWDAKQQQKQWENSKAF